MTKQSSSFSFFQKALLFPFLFAVLALILFLEVFHIKDLSYISCFHDPDHCITKYSNLIYGELLVDQLCVICYVGALGIVADRTLQHLNVVYSFDL